MYTDTENTGVPAVPNTTTDRPDGRSSRDELAESVWSHRLRSPAETREVGR